MAATTERVLPTAFEDLSPFLDWAEPTERGRHRQRLSSSLAEIRAFYDVMHARIDAVLDYLNEKPLDKIAGADKVLLDLALALPEAANAVELFESPEHPYGMPIERFVPVHDLSGERAREE